MFHFPIGRYNAKRHAPVAQLDRAADFESVGREFEPLRARQFSSLYAAILVPLQSAWTGKRDKFLEHVVAKISSQSDGTTNQAISNRAVAPGLPGIH